MRRNILVLLSVCLFLTVIGGLLLRPKANAGCRLSLEILGATNGPAGKTSVTLRLANTGLRSAQVLPVFGVEFQPAREDPSMSGLVSSTRTLLRSGELWTNSISIPTLSGHSWRVFFYYWEQRPPLSAFWHFWRMQFGLVSRGDEGSIVYTDWATNESLP